MRLSGSAVSTSNPPYKGFNPYKMDPKYRVSVPPLWRPAEGKSLFLLFSRKHDLPVVKVLSQEAYEGKVARVEDSDKTPKEKDEILERLAMLSREASVNDQGKLTIPKDMSEKAGIGADSDVMLAGRGNFFEIWSESNFATVLEIETGQKIGDDLNIF